MSFSSFIVNRLAALLRVPSAAVEMLRAANSISGIEKKALPTELISLNAMQFSRGMLNYSFFQSNLRWVFPYWVVRQYDPSDPSFIPRSHLGFSMNLTQRNWTAVGTPECSTEPIVDPRGLVTPFRDGWSIDTWITTGGRTYFPSQGPATQSLHDHYPVVITEFSAGPMKVRLTTFVDRSMLLHSVCVTNTGLTAIGGAIQLALRPFNPEGVGMITSLIYDPHEQRVRVNGRESVYFSEAPQSMWCSDYQDGDSAWVKGEGERNRSASECEAGFANGWFCFPVALPSGAEQEIVARVPLDETARLDAGELTGTSIGPLRNVLAYWDDALHRGGSIVTPDEGVNGAVKSSLITLLMLCDGDTITPGPAIYHHFWFRDAAFMIHALDAFGHHARTGPIIDNFFTHQEAGGYLRSQKGEWDSNGQVLWVMLEHAMLSGSLTRAEKNFPALVNAVTWIDRRRMTHAAERGQQYYGLMPSGLSAEHLGLADHYYWDNFWSLTGVRSFIDLCSLLSHDDEPHDAQQLFDRYLTDIKQALSADRARLGSEAMPAAPGRAFDCGMIGSVSALYPLQLIELGEARLEETIKTILAEYFRDDLFFQSFIHSGLNIYLSLQTAHACLLLGDRASFTRIFTAVMQHASPTGTFPEAIHPATGGGSMGDGHHGWAAAELVLAVRSMFILETATELRLLSGTPEEWYCEGQKCSLRNIPSHSGVVGISVDNNFLETHIVIDWKPNNHPRQTRWIVALPFRASSVEVDREVFPFHTTASGETEIHLTPGPSTIVVKR